MGEGQVGLSWGFGTAKGARLIGEGLAPRHYVASQGTVLGRVGRIHVDADADGIWIGGDTTDRVRGQVILE